MLTTKSVSFPLAFVHLLHSLFISGTWLFVCFTVFGIHDLFYLIGRKRTWELKIINKNQICIDLSIFQCVYLTCFLSNDLFFFKKFESEMQSIAPSSPAEIREKILARQKSRRENLHHNETKQETSAVNSAKSSDMVPEANVCEKEAVL